MTQRKINVPTLSESEIVKGVEALADYAKRRFLDGAVEEAVSLADHAARLASNIDTAAASELKSLAATFRSHLPAAPAAAAVA